MPKKRFVLNDPDYQPEHWGDKEIELANHFMLPKAYRESWSEVCGRLGISHTAYYNWRNHPTMQKYVKELRRRYFNDDVPDIMLALKHNALAGDTNACKIFLDEVREQEEISEIKRGKIITKDGVVAIWEEIKEKKI